MTRWILLAVLVVAASALAPIVVSTLPLGDASPGNLKPKPKKKMTGPPGKAVVDGDLTYSFGKMALHDAGTHVWTIKNEGQGDLILSKGEHTCSCTVANLGEGDTLALKPGKSTEVKLTWDPRHEGKFRQSADINVDNDPDTSVLKFIIEGDVEPPIRLMPPEPLLDFGPMSEGEPKTGYVAMASADRPDLKITAITPSNPERVKVTATPLTEAEQKSANLGPGYRLNFEVRPGKALGTFQDQVVIKTDHRLQPELVIVVTGRVDGPVTVSPERLRSVGITSARGGTLLAKLWVRGQENTNFTVAEKPKGLKVEIEPDEVSLPTVKAKQYRMTVTVPPGAPLGVTNGEIVLKTDHPLAEQVKVPVSLFVTE
jgi:hypothetical protein